MSSTVGAYAFAADAAYTRRLMRQYAAAFTRGPVADLGSGRGFFLEALRERGIEGIGVDRSDEAIRASRELGFECLQMDVLEYLRGAGTLHGVFASHVIEHLPPARAEAMLSLASAVLAPGGRIVVVTPNMADFTVLSEIFWLDTTHVRPYPPRWIAAALEQHGVRVEEIGRGRTPQGIRKWPRTMLGRLRFGMDYGRTEVFVSGVRA